MVGSDPGGPSRGSMLGKWGACGRAGGACGKGGRSRAERRESGRKRESPGLDVGSEFLTGGRWGLVHFQEQLPFTGQKLKQVGPHGGPSLARAPLDGPSENVLRFS